MFMVFTDFAYFFVDFNILAVFYLVTFVMCGSIWPDTTLPYIHTYISRTCFWYLCCLLLSHNCADYKTNISVKNVINFLYITSFYANYAS